MGNLYLVRHAQASFLEENYDKLSVLGETQARLLGEYWARRNVVFNRAGTGPRARQTDTAQIVAGAYAKAGIAYPETQTLPEFDEYPGEAVMERSLPGLLASDQRIRQLHEAFERSQGGVSRRATFHKLFEAVISKWVSGTICLEGVETWVQFCSRVNSGLVQFLSKGERGETVVIFTSGGPIAVALRRALQLSAENTLQMSWMSRNSSWSEFLYGSDRFTLSAFNVHGHIDDPAMITHR
jgi:broad specificity phosphatase PhoE